MKNDTLQKVAASCRRPKERQFILDSGITPYLTETNALYDFNDVARLLKYYTEFLSSETWIPLTRQNMPPLNQEVLAYRIYKPGHVGYKKGLKGCTMKGYLFKLDPNERDGYIDGDVPGDKAISLSPGGIFWAFPCIDRFEDVTHYQLLPADPIF